MAVMLDTITGHLSGPEVRRSERTVGAMAGYYADESARAALPQDIVVYRMEAYEPVPEGQEGAVCCATTFLESGRVGDEYFMTRGHFHAMQDRPEMEVTVSGEGALILMDEDRHTWMEPMRPGSIHAIPPRTAHRVANTGDTPLVFVSYWPSETGHDYSVIASQGFGARLRDVHLAPTLVPETSEGC